MAAGGVPEAAAAARASAAAAEASHSPTVARTPPSPSPSPSDVEGAKAPAAGVPDASGTPRDAPRDVIVPPAPTATAAEREPVAAAAGRDLENRRPAKPFNGGRWNDLQWRSQLKSDEALFVMFSVSPKPREVQLASAHRVPSGVTSAFSKCVLDT